jgi:hypothetical protein
MDEERDNAIAEITRRSDEPDLGTFSDRDKYLRDKCSEGLRLKPDEIFKAARLRAGKQDLRHLMLDGSVANFGMSRANSMFLHNMTVNLLRLGSKFSKASVSERCNDYEVSSEFFNIMMFEMHMDHLGIASETKLVELSPILVWTILQLSRSFLGVKSSMRTVILWFSWVDQISDFISQSEGGREDCLRFDPVSQYLQEKSEEERSGLYVIAFNVEGISLYRLEIFEEDKAMETERFMGHRICKHMQFWKILSQILRMYSEVPCINLEWKE